MRSRRFESSFRWLYPHIKRIEMLYLLLEHVNVQFAIAGIRLT